MRRSLFTIATVAAISSWISWGEHAVGRPGDDWVRTADGWQSRRVLAAEPFAPPPVVHPAVVAGLQLGMSLFCLIAFPSRVTAVRPATVEARNALRRRGQQRRAGANRLAANAS